MKIFNDIEQNTPEWFDLRKGKITGSKFHGIIVKRGTGKKKGFYELLAERVATEKDGEDARERGHRLEEEAILELEKEFGTIDRPGFCVRDDNENIAISMDGAQLKKLKAFEVKCLNSADHLRAYFEQAIPGDYFEQAIQYFVVWDELEELVFAFYDPRVSGKTLHYISMKREDFIEDIKKQHEYQMNTLEEIEKMAEQIAF
jgi:hypothetical protein